MEIAGSAGNLPASLGRLLDTGFYRLSTTVLASFHFPILHLLARWGINTARLLRSSSGSGHRPLTAEIEGSNPFRSTN